MTDLSALSNEDLQALHARVAGPDFSGLSDEGLLDLYSAIQQSTPTATKGSAMQSPSPEARPTPGEMALEGMSSGERALVGIGKAFSDTWHGAKQLGAEAVNAISPEWVSDETVRGLRAEADETKRRDAALMADPYGRGGNLGGNIALGVALPASRVPSAIASATALGAVQPVGTDESRTQNAIHGATAGTIGAGIAGGIGRVLYPVRTTTPVGTANLIKDAEAAGYRFSAGRATGSRKLMNAEDALEVLPTGGSKLAENAAHNQRLTNQIVGRHMGEQVDAITPEVIAGARARIGAAMDSLTQNRQFNVDRKFFDDIFRIRAAYGQTLKGQQSGEIRSMLDELASGARTRNPQIEAAQYQRTASALKQEAEAAFRSGTNINDARVKREIADALEGLAERNFTGTELQAFREAQRQYNATLIAERVVRPDGSGDIAIEKLHQATKEHRRVANRQGDNDELVFLGRLGQQLKKQLTPNSGTAERQWWLKAMQNPLTISALAGGGGYLAGGGDGATALGAAVSPLLLGRAMYTRPIQNWLREGIPFRGRNALIEALSRTAPGVASGVNASELSAR